MALSNEFGWMVLTTGNKSEMAVGYFTIYGDSVGGYAVIKDVLKTRVYDLCRYVNRARRARDHPEGVITKPPSAELRPDQRDDQTLPPYEVLDPILELYVEDDRTAAEIVELGHDEAMVRRVTRLVDIAEYKRHQCPPGVRVSTKAFGATAACRSPTATAADWPRSRQSSADARAGGGRSSRRPPPPRVTLDSTATRRSRGPRRAGWPGSW